MSGIARRLTDRDVGHPLRVGIDGRVGAGKTTFARDLVEALGSMGRPAIHLDSDGFHHVQVVRRRQGSRSARGYYEDAYDFDTLARRVLEPLGAAPPFIYATKVHDLVSDQPTLDETATAEPGSIVVFDCTFLQRGALRELWDEVIWLEVGRQVATERG
ncbi:MAG: uridine kinase, partial [Actinomycetales bacterium]